MITDRGLDACGLAPDTSSVVVDMLGLASVRLVLHGFRRLVLVNLDRLQEVFNSYPDLVKHEKGQVDSGDNNFFSQDQICAFLQAFTSEQVQFLEEHTVGIMFNISHSPGMFVVCPPGFTTVEASNATAVLSLRKILLAKSRILWRGLPRCGPSLRPL